MLGVLVTSLLFVLMGVLGLLMAALAKDPAAQVMGLGLVVLAWFFMVGYHGRRVEQNARRESSH